MRDMPSSTYSIMPDSLKLELKMQTGLMPVCFFNKNLKKGLVFLKQCGIIIDVMYDVMLYESGVMSQSIKYDNSRII